MSEKKRKEKIACINRTRKKKMLPKKRNEEAGQLMADSGNLRKVVTTNELTTALDWIIFFQKRNYKKRN